MVNQLGFTKRFLSLVTPIVASSALAPLALSIAASPGMAATLASSEAKFNINNFSHNPLKVAALTEADAFTVATSGQVTVEAKASANFINSQSPPYAYNSSFSTVNGDDGNYLGIAESEAEVMGYNFLVEKGETFSFNFNGFLNLNTSISDPEHQSASVGGDLSLELYDSTNPDKDKWILLDSFTLAGALTTLGDDDFLLDPDKSASITLTPSETYSVTSFGGTQESAEASVQGSLERSFDSLTYLTLVEAKINQAEAISNQASAAVPEPASIVALLFGLTGLGYKIRNKAFGAK